MTSEAIQLPASAIGATVSTRPLSSTLAAASTRIRARRSRLIRSTIDSWTLVLTRILLVSGRLKIFWCWRTAAPSSIWRVCWPGRPCSLA